MSPRTLRNIFEWFTTLELLIARMIVFLLFVIGICTVAYLLYRTA